MVTVLPQSDTLGLSVAHPSRWVVGTFELTCVVEHTKVSRYLSLVVHCLYHDVCMCLFSHNSLVLVIWEIGLGYKEILPKTFGAY